jgi:hypothetical protein
MFSEERHAMVLSYIYSRAVIERRLRAVPMDSKLETKVQRRCQWKRLLSNRSGEEVRLEFLPCCTSYFG